MDEQTLRDAVAELPHAEIAVGTPFVQAFVDVGLEKGLGAARRTIASGGLSVNNVKITDNELACSQEHVLPGGIVLLRKGKKNLAVAYVK